MEDRAMVVVVVEEVKVMAAHSSPIATTLDILRIDVILWLASQRDLLMLFSLKFRMLKRGLNLEVIIGIS